MRGILIIVLASLTAYVFFLLADIQPANYVKIYVASYTVEMKFIVFLILVLLLMLAIHLLFGLVKVAWKSPKSFTGWRTRRANKQADAALGAGYLSLIKGDWRLAEKTLLKKANASRVPYVNYLAAAQAAQEQGQMQRRDSYLAKAYQAAPKERLAIGLTKARLHQAAGQYELAATTLHDLQEVGQQNAQYTAMLMQTYQQLGYWDQAVALLPVARKQSALPGAVLDEIYNESHTSKLQDNQDKEVAWKALPKDQRKRAPNIALYADHLIDQGDHHSAEKMIRVALKSDWSEELAHLYGKLSSDKPAKLRRVVEGWLMARPESPELHLAAGQFALQEKNNDLAREHLQKAVQLGQLPKAYSLLGELYESCNESGKALQLYRAGMINLSKLTDEDMLADMAAPAEGELLLADKPRKA